MSYRFNGSSSVMEFSPAPLVGSALGNWTFAMLLKRNSVGGSSPRLLYLMNSGLSSVRIGWEFTSSNLQRLNNEDARTSSGGTAGTSTSLFEIVASTHTAGVTTPRFHQYEGTSWSHAAGDFSMSNLLSPVASSDRLRVGQSLALNADVVCAGIKTVNSADLTVETLSLTSWTAWLNFGFDWLIGFDTSLTSGGVLQDQSAAGTGDEVLNTNTSVVADPAGWTWPSVSPIFVPQVMIT
jgi:hypothetical protein